MDKMSSGKDRHKIPGSGLEWQLTYAPVFQPVDYYNKFRDLWKKQSYGIIKQK